MLGSQGGDHWWSVPKAASTVAGVSTSLDGDAPDRAVERLIAWIKDRAKLHSYRGAALVLEYGRSWIPSGDLAAFDLDLGESKQCFVNAGDFALAEADSDDDESRSRFFYCEGYAIAAPDEFVAVEHAWLGTPTGHAVEVTWQRPGAAYFGVGLRDAALREWVMEGEVWGPFLATHNPRKFDPQRHSAS